MGRVAVIVTALALAVAAVLAWDTSRSRSELVRPVTAPSDALPPAVTTTVAESSSGRSLAEALRDAGIDMEGTNVYAIQAESSSGRSLAEALRDAGIDMEGTDVYAIQIAESPAGLVQVEHEAGGGQFAENFWPASSIKVFAAVGTLVFVNQLGFTSAASVSFSSGPATTVADLVTRALRDSSNDAYDLLVQIAGLDWLNENFLNAENGFPITVIQRSYSGLGVRLSPAMTLTEDGRSVDLPARTTTDDYGCADDGNCTNLAELATVLRRIVLNDRVPEGDRFDISSADTSLVPSALAAADGFLTSAAAEGATVYAKPGYVPGDNCVEVAVVGDRTAHEWVVLAISTPDDGPTCNRLTTIEANALRYFTGS